MLSLSGALPVAAPASDVKPRILSWFATHRSAIISTSVVGSVACSHCSSFFERSDCWTSLPWSFKTSMRESPVCRFTGQSWSLHSRRPHPHPQPRSYYQFQPPSSSEITGRTTQTSRQRNHLLIGKMCIYSTGTVCPNCRTVVQPTFLGYCLYAMHHDLSKCTRPRPSGTYRCRRCNYLVINGRRVLGPNGNSRVNHFY